jgi:signal transduction histidine kinase
VKTFLDFTRPVELQLKEVDLVDLARQVARLVWPGAEKGAVSVELDSKIQRAWARVDEDLIKQALINVVNNGVEAMPKGGRLSVGVHCEAEHVVVTVTDQGPGIPAEIRDKIFNLYFTTKPSGSGIGLAMTFRIVQLHNGTVEFTSDPLTGTTFRMRFPASENMSSSEPTPAGDTLSKETQPPVDRKSAGQSNVLTGH